MPDQLTARGPRAVTDLRGHRAGQPGHLGQRHHGQVPALPGQLDHPVPLGRAVPAHARRLPVPRLAGAAREREELRAWSERQADSLRADLARAREDAARLAGQVREDCAARVAALEAGSAGLRGERDRLAADLRAAARKPRQDSTSPAQGGQPGRARRDGPTKRDRMIELAAQRRDLAVVPLTEVSRLASTVAAEIGYSPGTARRELVRHVRELQGAPGEGTPGSEGGQAR